MAVLLLDVHMPYPDGTDVLRRIHNDEAYAYTAVVVTGGSGEDMLVLQALSEGAVGFVEKPVNPQMARLWVQSAVQTRQNELLRTENHYLTARKDEELRHQRELQRMISSDSLTGIPNRTGFSSRMQALLRERPDDRFALLCCDIERFKVINDMLGYDAGDRLLKYIAGYLQRFAGENGACCRMSADRFALCVPDEKGRVDAIIEQMDGVLKEYGLPFELQMTFGCYIIDDRLLSVDGMIDRAQLAQRSIKGRYLTRCAYYDEKLRRALLNEQEIVSQMNAALEERQFVVYLQPRCRLDTGEITGAEALVRWAHPQKGLLAPGGFIPVFERNGFILRLDAFVWEEVCRLLRGWIDAGREPLPVSVNISRVNLYNPQLVPMLRSLIQRYALPARLMELEVTESAYSENPRLLTDVMRELRAAGFTVEIDDFGSGYSALSSLKDLDADVLKLDMRFLMHSVHDQKGRSILTSMVLLAQQLHMGVIVEGVETAEQVEFLEAIGCHVAQGFYFYRPMPVSAYEALPRGTAHQRV